MIDCIAILSVPLLFFLLLLFAPGGVWKMGNRLKSNPKIVENASTHRAQELKKITDEFLGIFDKAEVEKSKLSYQLQKLQSSISYTIGRHDWYEAQRSGLITKLITVIGLTFTALGLFIGQFNNELPIQVILMVISVGIVLLGSLVYGMHLYNSELDEDRPYRLVSDVRYWYFRYSLPAKTARYGERLDFENISNDVLREREKYLDRILESSNFDQSLREDFEQLFILHILNRYKSESLGKMRWLFSLTVIILALSATWFFIYYNLISS